MSVIVILILISLVLALLFLGCFIWAVRSGQYEDTATPAFRLLGEEEKISKAKNLTQRQPPHERNSVT